MRAAGVAVVHLDAVDVVAWLLAQDPTVRHWLAIEHAGDLEGWLATHHDGWAELTDAEKAAARVGWSWGRIHGPAPPEGFDLPLLLVEDAGSSPLDRTMGGYASTRRGRVRVVAACEAEDGPEIAGGLLAAAERALDNRPVADHHAEGGVDQLGRPAEIGEDPLPRQLIIPPAPTDEEMAHARWRGQAVLKWSAVLGSLGDEALIHEPGLIQRSTIVQVDTKAHTTE